MQQLETIIYTKEEDILGSKFNRPKVPNATNLQLVRELLIALEEARHNWR